ncbi:MAG TPA: 2-oxoacid:acceptor oxidoreductase family protein [bacterium]
MQGITEIRWHGRAGQGTVSAAKILADTAMAAGDFVQAFPEYGPEREGAPLRAYNRIAKRRFSIYCEIEHPGVIVVMDPTLLDTVNVTDGATPETVFLVNSPKCVADLKVAHPQLAPYQVWTVDATNISLGALGKSFPNTPTLGAVAKVTGVIGLDALLACVKGILGKKLSAEVIEKNLSIVRRGFEEVQS